MKTRAAAGFVDPIYLILIAVATTGLALVVPALQPFLNGEPASAWDWASLVAGAALIAGSVAWYVRLK